MPNGGEIEIIRRLPIINQSFLYQNVIMLYVFTIHFLGDLTDVLDFANLHDHILLNTQDILHIHLEEVVAHNALRVG